LKEYNLCMADTMVPTMEIAEPKILFTPSLVEADLTGQIIGAAIDVHRVLGPGLLESAYQACMCRELTLRDLSHRTQVELPVHYKGVRIECGYRIDLVVNNRIVVELKSVEHLLAVHEAQLLTYLRLSGIKVGLLINFNVAILRRGILRRVL
jgi:GxxExxY protein